MISVKGVSYSYEPGAEVLRDVSFDVARGERIVLLGSNGSGKTTLLRVMDGLIFPSRGEVEYEGAPVTKRSLRAVPLRNAFRREVALLFQNPEAMIFNPTVFDEIAFGPRQTMIDAAEVEERVRRWAGLFGITKHLDRPAFQLSKGEMQKVCLASLLALEPKLLLLDEPAASLDPRSTGWLIDLLQDLGLTTVVTTHNLSMARELGERTLLLSEHHELIFDGDIDTLLGDPAKLMEANLVHSHRHAHGDVEHRHYHTHDWE